MLCSPKCTYGTLHWIQYNNIFTANVRTWRLKSKNPYQLSFLSQSASPLELSFERHPNRRSLKFIQTHIAYNFHRSIQHKQRQQFPHASAFVTTFVYPIIKCGPNLNCDSLNMDSGSDACNLCEASIQMLVEQPFAD